MLNSDRKEYHSNNIQKVRSIVLVIRHVLHRLPENTKLPCQFHAASFFKRLLKVPNHDDQLLKADSFFSPRPGPQRKYIFKIMLSNNGLLLLVLASVYSMKGKESEQIFLQFLILIFVGAVWGDSLPYLNHYHSRVFPTGGSNEIGPVKWCFWWFSLLL